jgi:hypothetical protein
MTRHYRLLRGMRACSDGLDDVARHETWQGWWDASQRPDWMLWALARCVRGAHGSDEHKAIVRIAVACAETALPHVKDEHTQGVIRHCLQVVTAWLEGHATLDEVRAARWEAWDAAADAYAYAADAYAADAAAYARSRASAAMADIVRAHVPVAPDLEARR